MKKEGSGIGQQQQKAQTQRPNNTLADFITVQPSKGKQKALETCLRRCVER